MQLLFENPYCKLFLDETIPALYQEWTGFVAGAPLYEAHEATIDLLKTHQISRVLADTRQMRVIPRADQQWIAETFFPQALAAGYRRVAIVQSEDTFNQTSVQNILSFVADSGSFVAENFLDPEAARAWLRAG